MANYADAKSTGDSYRYAAKNLLAVQRNASAGMLDDAIYNAAWQSQMLADKVAKSKSGYTGTLVDIFA